jgi:hypothetical protein
MTGDQSDTCSSLPRQRGRSQKSIDLIEAMVDICAAAQPTTGRSSTE